MRNRQPTCTGMHTLCLRQARTYKFAVPSTTRSWRYRSNASGDELLILGTVKVTVILVVSFEGSSRRRAGRGWLVGGLIGSGLPLPYTHIINQHSGHSHLIWLQQA